MGLGYPFIITNWMQPFLSFYSAATSFYRSLATLTDGYHLHLDQFSSIIDFIMAICFREQSMEQLQAFEDEVRSRGDKGMNRSLHNLFDTLAGRSTTYSGMILDFGLQSMSSSQNAFCVNRVP